MPQITNRDVHVDRLLTNISVGYSNLRYIADRIFPILTVTNQSGLVPRFTKSHWFRNDAKMRAPGSQSVGGGWELDTPLAYFTPRYSYRDEISDELRDNADSVYQIDATSTNFVTDKLFLAREVQWAQGFFTTGVWTDDQVGGSDFVQWSDYGASSPLSDITGYMDDVEARIGIEPNIMVLGKQAYHQLRWHPDLLDTIKYTQRGIITEEIVSSMLGLELLIGRAIHTTDPEGTAEASVTYSRVWGKHALLMYVTPNTALNSPTAGYTFVWNRVRNALQYIKRMRNEEREIEIIEANGYWDMQQTSPDAGLFLQNVVA